MEYLKSVLLPALGAAVLAGLAIVLKWAIVLGFVYWVGSVFGDDLIRYTELIFEALIEGLDQIC